MAESPLPLLILYCLAIALASLAGGLLPSRVRMTHTRTQLAMSGVAGLMLGVAFFHLLPHAVVLNAGADAVDSAVRWLMAGLILMLLLLRLFHFHQHDPVLAEALPTSLAEHATAHAHAEHTHAHHGHAHHAHAVPAHPASGLGIALGLGLHSLIDGVALAAAVRSSAGHELGPLGAGVFLAILLHKPLDAMSVTAILQSGGWPAARVALVNAGFALLCPLAALVFYLGMDGLLAAHPAALGAALAFSAGAFICIALSDLLPEVHFHSHDRVSLTAALLLGVALALGIGSLEPSGAHHHPAAGAPPVSQPESAPGAGPAQPASR